MLTEKTVNSLPLDRLIHDESFYRERNFFEQLEREDLNDRLLRELDPKIERFKYPPVIQILEDLSKDISNSNSYNDLKTILKNLFISGHPLQVLDFFDRVIMFEEEQNISRETSFLESLKSVDRSIGPKLQKEPEQEGMRMTLVALGCSELALDSKEFEDIRNWTIYKADLEKEDVKTLLEFSLELRKKYQITLDFFYSNIKKVSDLTSFVSMLTDYHLRDYYIPEDNKSREWFEKTPKTNWNTVFKSNQYREMSFKQLLESIRRSNAQEEKITLKEILAKQPTPKEPVRVVPQVYSAVTAKPEKVLNKSGLDLGEIDREVEKVREKYYESNSYRADIPKEKYEIWLQNIVKEMLANSPELEAIASQITESVQNMEIYIGSYSNQYVYETPRNKVSLLYRLESYYKEPSYKQYEDSYPNFKRIEFAVESYKRMMGKNKV